MRCWKQASILKAVALCMLLASSASHSDIDSDSAERYQLNVKSQTVEQALRSLANASSRQLLFPYDQMEALKSISISGRYTLEEALGIILKDTSLSGELTTEGVILVTPIQKKSDRGSEMKNRKKILAATIGFFVGAGGVQQALAEETQSGEEMGWLLEEVVVTATKRATSLQDTAVAISVLSSDTIEKRGLVDMNDYLATIPGASFIEYGATNKKIVLRGLSVGPRDPQSTASAYLGDIPVSSALASFDVALVDVERIEVLKGPQGTLFGSNSLGGLVRTIPMSPNLNEIEGNLKVDLSTQDESDDTNHSLTGVFNIPLIEDQLALRIAAYKFSEAGYIDIVSSPSEDAIATATGATAIVKDDSNSSSNEGVRVSMLWQPTEDLKVDLIYGSQKNDVDNGSNSLISLSGDQVLGYQTSYLNTPATERSDLEYSNLVIEYDFGWATLLSSSSLLNNEGNALSNNFSLIRDSFFGPVQFDSTQDTNLKTQEIRLASNLNGQWEYLAGLFYEKSELNGTDLFDWVGTITENPFGQKRLLHVLTDLNYEQKAIFGEVSYQFNDQWLLTLGGRHFQYDRVDTSTHVGTGPFNGVDSNEDIDESGNTYKANLAFTPNENTLIYGQWSEGFRLGRGQTIPNLALCDTEDNGPGNPRGNGKLDFTDGGLTARVESDTTTNLELGLKISLLNNRFLVNAAVFKTGWDNLPTAIRDTSDTCPGSTEIINNIGSAESQGIEVDATYLLDAWQFSLSASYMDTKRTNTQLPVVEGERLIYAPRTNAGLGIQYNFVLNDYSGYVRSDIGYVGKYPSAESSFAYPYSGGYVDASLHFGIAINQWDLSFYGTNLMGDDEIRIINGEFAGNMQAIRAVPRRIGVQISYDF